MPTEILALLGAGGHAKVVYNAVCLAWPGICVLILDDDPAKQNSRFLNVKVQVPIGPISALPECVHVAIGDNTARRLLGDAVLRAGKILATICHPKASVSEFASIEDGVFVGAGAIVAPDANIGTGVIVNHAAVIDHDCRVGSWSHIAPTATLGGGVTVGEYCMIGAGSVILPGISIGDNAIVAAGAVVTRNVSSGTTVMGVPART